MIDISVIIPVYKPDDLFYECMDSLTLQTFPVDRFEVIVVLNGERVPFEERVLNYISRSSLHIKFFYCETADVSGARNKGMEEAAGRYISFIDADDFISACFLEKMFTAAEDGTGFSISNVCPCNNTKKPVYDRWVDKGLRNIVPGKAYPHSKTRLFFAVPWGKLMQKDACKKAFFDSRFDYGEDALYMFRIEPFLPMATMADGEAVYYKRELSTSLSKKKRGFTSVARLHVGLMKEYWRLFFSKKQRYSLRMFVRRNLALLMHIIKGR